MNWKLLIVCLLFITVGYTVFMGVQFWLSGPPFTLEGFISFVIGNTMKTVNDISLFVQDKVLAVTGTIFTALGVVFGVIKLVQNKISGVRQTYENKMGDMQFQATQQYVDMNNKITEVTAERDSLQSQVQDQSVLASQITDLKAQLASKDEEIQQAIQRANTAELDAYRKLNPQVICRRCQTSYPASLEFCPTCQTPQLVKQ